MKCKEIEWLNYKGEQIGSIRVQNTKLLRAALNEYLHSNCEDIYDCYKRPSDRKVSIFNILKYEYEDNGSIKPARILSHNSQFFSMGTIIEKNNRKYFVYDTQGRRRVLDCTDML